jgi:hypothetical protein
MFIKNRIEYLNKTYHKEIDSGLIEILVPGKIKGIKIFTFIKFYLSYVLNKRKRFLSKF